MKAIEMLRKYQKQCDPDGIEVQVSRQALDEVLDRIELFELKLRRCGIQYDKYDAEIGRLERCIAEKDALLKELNSKEPA